MTLISEHLTAPHTSADELLELFEQQRRIARQEGVVSTTTRRERIDRLIALVTEHADDIAEALDADFGGRPRAVTWSSDILGGLADVLEIRKNVARWSKGRRAFAVGVVAGVRTRVERRPRGVVGIIGPWNFPVGLVVQPAAAALAAGNRVMIKMSEIVPRTATLMQVLAQEYFPDGAVTVVTGDHLVGAAFSELPFGHIFFTGSPGVGAKVAAAAGKNLVPVTLELGGKNPVVIDRGTDIDRAASRIAAARLVNGGQICLCPEIVFVPQEDVGRFVNHTIEGYAHAWPTVATNEAAVSIVNDRNFERVSGLIEDARSRGAQVTQWLPPGETLPDAARRRIAPTVVQGVTDDMLLAHEEVFGPILMVFGYRTIDDVIAYLVERPAPLAAYWHGRKSPAFTRFTQHVPAGGITMNDFALHCAIPGVPFGGVGHSGSGAYHGKAGVDAFTHEQVVVDSRLRFSLGSVMVAPFGKRTWRVLESYRARTARRARRGFSVQ